MDIYSIAPIEDWVNVSKPTINDSHDYHSSPYFFYLVDYQDLISPEAIHYYRHTVERINDSSRIEDASLLITEIEDGREMVVFHKLNIIRDSQTIDLLDEGLIEVMRREKSLEAHLSDKKLTVSISIDDLREDDILEYCSTIIEVPNNHPVKGKHFYSRYWLNWSCPVIQQKICITNNSKKTILVQHYSSEKDNNQNVVDEIHSGESQGYDFADLLPKQIDNTAPDWVWSDCLIASTDMSWKQISGYLFEYYSEQSDSINTIDINNIEGLNLSADKETAILDIVRFVQDKIRYRGENHGIFSHTPKRPEQTLKKRSGDCKDKSNLLVTLLSLINIDANLVLVNTNIGDGLKYLMPSTYCFNHMIVRVVHNGKEYYFDATIKKQRGDLEHIQELNFGFVLNLTKNGEDLKKIPYKFEKKVLELDHVFDLSKGNNGECFFTVERKFYAHRADNMRYYFSSNEKKKLEENYHNWAKEDTGLDLVIEKPVSVLKDDEKNNLLITTEKYKIINLNQTHEDRNINIETEYYKELPLPSTKKYPVQTRLDGMMEHNIKVITPYQQTENNIGNKSVANKYFIYEDRILYSGKNIYLLSSITPFDNLINVEDIDEYIADANKVHERYNNSFPHVFYVGESKTYQIIMIFIFILLILGMFFNIYS